MWRLNTIRSDDGDAFDRDLLNNINSASDSDSDVTTQRPIEYTPCHNMDLSDDDDDPILSGRIITDFDDTVIDCLFPDRAVHGVPSNSSSDDSVMTGVDYGDHPLSSNLHMAPARVNGVGSGSVRRMELARTQRQNSRSNRLRTLSNGARRVRHVGPVTPSFSTVQTRHR